MMTKSTGVGRGGPRRSQRADAKKPGPKPTAVRPIIAIADAPALLVWLEAHPPAADEPARPVLEHIAFACRVALAK